MGLSVLLLWFFGPNPITAPSPNIKLNAADGYLSQDFITCAEHQLSKLDRIALVLETNRVLNGSMRASQYTTRQIIKCFGRVSVTWTYPPHLENNKERRHFSVSCFPRKTDWFRRRTTERVFFFEDIPIPVPEGLTVEQLNSLFSVVSQQDPRWHVPRHRLSKQLRRISENSYGLTLLDYGDYGENVIASPNADEGIVTDPRQRAIEQGSNTPACINESTQTR